MMVYILTDCLTDITKKQKLEKQEHATALIFSYLFFFSRSNLFYNFPGDNVLFLYETYAIFLFHYVISKR